MGDLDEPFPGSWAIRAGLVTRWQLRHDFTRVHRDVYVRNGVALDARLRGLAAGQWAKGRATLVGFSAAALLGTNWIDASRPAELALEEHSRTPPGVTGRRDALLDDELCTIEGFRCSTAERTAFDIGCRLPTSEAIPILDALCNATGIEPKSVEQVAARHPRHRGIVELRRSLPLVDGGAESPPESRTRLLLVDNGLPAPETQLRIRGPHGSVIARADLGWRRWKVIVEYDGSQHWSDRNQRSWDIDRTAILEAMGWQVIRVSAELLRDRPYVVIARVRAALHAAGLLLTDERALVAANVERRPPPVPARRELSARSAANLSGTA